MPQGPRRGGACVVTCLLGSVGLAARIAQGLVAVGSRVDEKGGKLAPSEVVDTRFKTPASGLISTVIDLTQLANALFDSSLLPPRLFQEMLFVPPLPASERPRFTAGWTLTSGV